ncbi:hypothetical protein DNTS_029900, partial [Danionella cerebrum]
KKKSRSARLHLSSIRSANQRSDQLRCGVNSIHHRSVRLCYAANRTDEPSRRSTTTIQQNDSEEHRCVLQAEFEQYAADVKKIKSRPSDQELLDLYGLYKQALVGDINTDKPGMLDMKAKAKWEAWNSRKGMSNEDAMTAYITLAKGAIEKYGM